MVRVGRPTVMVESRMFCDRLADELILMFRLEKRVLKPTDEVRVDCVLVWGLYIEVRLFWS